MLQRKQVQINVQAIPISAKTSGGEIIIINDLYIAAKKKAKAAMPKRIPTTNNVQLRTVRNIFS